MENVKLNCNALIYIICILYMFVYMCCATVDKNDCYEGFSACCDDSPCEVVALKCPAESHSVRAGESLLLTACLLYECACTFSNQPILFIYLFF